MGKKAKGRPWWGDGDVLGDEQMWVFHPGPLIPEQQLTVNTDSAVEYGQLLGK